MKSIKVGRTQAGETAEEWVKTYTRRAGTRHAWGVYVGPAGPRPSAAGTLHPRVALFMLRAM